jgi:hypothetical protein
VSTNDYKPDTGKPPVRSAVLIPFRHALLALARMMQGQVARHGLAGAKDPFQEWAQLPDAEKRLHEAQGRHTLCPDHSINPDSGETHELHDLWNILAVVELQERAKLPPPAPLRGERAFSADGGKTFHPAAGAERGAVMCICGHRQDQHDVESTGRTLVCIADPSNGRGLDVCNCPEFREE